MINAAAERRARQPLRYSAELPWIGPILGPRPDRNASVQVGAAADPLRGKPLAAVFVPAKWRNDRLVPAKPDGTSGTVAEVAWIDWPASDRSGRFRMDAPHAWWEGKVSGVLMVLLYDLSGAVAPEDWRGYVENRLYVEKLLAAPLERNALPVSKLPPRERDEIAQRIADLLSQPSSELEKGLIELHQGPAASDGSASALTFAVGSCQYPAGFIDGDVAELAYQALKKCLDDAKPKETPRCLLLLGDQIYVDATAGLFDPLAKYDRYELPHEQLLRMKPLRHVLRRIPAYMMLDDHEIEDNWEPLRADDGVDPRLADGRHYYLKYQRMAGPDQVSVPADSDSTEPLWYPFTVDGFPFFMADTRTERTPRTVRTMPTARIMSEAQFNELLGWLVALKQEDKRRGEDIPKFIASPACFLPRHARAKEDDMLVSALRSESWDGYPWSFHHLLAHIVDHDIGNVVFLSGDEHISFVTCATIRAEHSGKSACIASVHSSALYAPYPFANSIETYLVGKECFEFTLPSGRYSCEATSTTFAPGDGFSLIDARQGGKGWKVTCRFGRAAGVGGEIPVLG